MSELNEFIPQVQASEIENDSDNEKKDDLVSDLQEANDILAYFKKEYGESEPEKYQELLKEHEDLRTTTIEAVKSENRITIAELDSIKKEFEDIKEIESYGDWWARKNQNIKESISQTFDSTVENCNYLKIVSLIETSDSDEKTEDKVHGILRHAQTILNGSKGFEYFDEVQEKYIAIEGIIGTSLRINNKFSQYDIEIIQDAYLLLLQLKDQYGIKEKGISTKSDNKNLQSKTEEANARLRGMRVSNAELLSRNAKNLLLLLNENYHNYEDGGFGLFSEVHDISELENKNEVLDFQRKLINKIIGNENGHGNGYIMSYSDEKGYFIGDELSIITYLKDEGLTKIDDKYKIIFIEYLYEKNHKNREKFIQSIEKLFGKEDSEDLIIIAEDNDIINTNESYKKEKLKAKQLKKDAIKFFNEANNQILTGDPVFQTAFKEELIKQKNEFDNAYIKYLDGDFSFEMLESELNNVKVLNTDNVISAVSEGLSHFFDFNIFGDDIVNVEEMKVKLAEMNLIYLAARANDVVGTETFKNERDKVAEQIIKLEKKEGIGIGRHETIGAITYNKKEIKASINNGSYSNIDKYKLYFFIQNEHGNFSDETTTQLLTQYPREFVRYISGQFLNEKGIMSALLGKDKDNKDFLLHLKDIDNVINLETSNNLNNATEDLNKKEVENAKKELLTPESRNRFIEKIKTSNPEELNQVMQELRIFAIQQTITENKEKFIIDIETENGVEKSDILFKKAMDLAPEVSKKGLYGEDLVMYLIKKIKNEDEIGTCVTNKHTKDLLEAFKNADNTTLWTLQEIQGDRAFSIPGDNEEHFNNYMQDFNHSSIELNSTIKKIDTLNEEEFDQFIEMVIDGNSFAEIDLYFSEINNDYNNLFNENISNNENLNNQNSDTSINNLFNENENITLNSGQPEIITKTGENIKLSDNDIKSIEQNPNNLDNIIHFSEVLIETGFENLWSAKDYLFKSIDNSIGIGFDINGDYLNTNELRIFFNTILKSLGYPEINGLADEQSIISHVKNLNDIQFGGETKDYNKDGDSKLENEFFKEFFPKDSTLGFKSAKFEEAIV